MFKRVLIIGYGSIGKRHHSVILKNAPDIEIAIYKPSKFEIKPDDPALLFSDIKNALDFQPDAIVVASPATFHLEAVRIFGPYCKYFLIEKPLAASLADCLEIQDLMQKYDLKISVGYQLRYSQSLSYFKSLIDKKLVGEIFSVRSEVGQFLPDWRPNSNFKQGVSANRHLGGGVLLELSHEFDYLQWIFGEIFQASGYCGKVSDVSVDVEDVALLLLKLRVGESCISASLNMDFIRRDRVRLCTVIGSEGSISWNGVNNSVRLTSSSSSKDDFREVRFHEDRNFAFSKQWAEFSNNIGFAAASSVIDATNIVHWISYVKNDNGMS